jgi:type IV secretory pathway VirJ component
MNDYYCVENKESYNSMLNFCISSYFNNFRLKSISLFSIIIYFQFTFVKCQAVSIDSVSIATFGKVYIYSNVNEPPQNLIILISGDGGWKYGVPEFAREFSKMNSVVVGIDIRKYYQHLRQNNEECYLIASDFVELATKMEHQYNFPEYEPPILMGYSSGATLVYGILAQARPGTFKGGISLAFCPDIELPKMLCQINGLKEIEQIKGKSYLFMPDAKLGNQWIVIQGMEDKICDFKTVNDFVSGTTDARIIALPKVGHDFSKWIDFMPQWKTAYTDLIAKFSSEKAQQNNIPLLKNIPAVITMGKSGVNSNLIALFLSGDGGWYNFEQSITNRFAELGITTIGIDIKKYLWNRKSPETLSSEMTELLKYYAKEWKRSQFILMGYSQGAEIVPFLFTRLPEEMKYNIRSLVMLSPGETTDFEIHITNMIGLGSKQNTFNVITELSEIRNTKQICIFGESEKTKVPELLKSTNVESVKIPGDHRFKGNSSIIVQTMQDKKAF